MPKDWIKVISDVTAIQAAEYELTTSDIKSSRIYSLLEGVSVIAIIGVMKFSDSTDLIRVLSDYLTRLKTVTISVSGSDVIARGLHPGPNVGLILRELLLYKLDGAIVTLEDELEMLNTILVQEPTGQ
jgi:tRNA nucleotidyltransferase (CCA-adding enzyme)